ncbi:MAG: polysaccharide deacetylase [Clostridia bacterium]|nr:polysaccharide deacetylase [Clostridia bacterium]
MDLISIARKYKNKKRILMFILLIIVIIYICLIVNKCIEDDKKDKIYQGYQDIYEKLNASNPEKGEKQENNDPNQNILTQEENINKEITQKELWIADVENIYKVEEKRVFLTFDDGPSKKVTPQILDLLKQENIKATFFVLGSRVELNPDIVKRAYEEGHYIANHGYSHTYSKIYASTQSVLDEYYSTEDAIKRAIGNDRYSSLLFRFPGGSNGGKYRDVKNQAKELLRTNNIAYVDWNALTGDAEGGKKTVEQLISRLNETISTKTSIVILMHDAGDKTTTYEALPQIIESLRANGYEFKNFYDLIK